ncbi:bifunctional P-450:NADPH-P450 reductase [Thozetella sp. PMI_491]|nr:bifunctional P-450:NADPH-P450 reductase [Thozetella sp. PMI_491]
MATTEIPQPPGWPIIGNLLDRNPARHREKYGPIFKLQPGAGVPSRVMVCSVELLNEICNEKVFAKSPRAGGLKQVRNLTHDGLFTALHGEENWGIAHRVLMPVLGSVAVKDMFYKMHDIVCQLVLKWARLGEGATVMVTEDFTRLTLDIIALCAMDTRFNSFYSETPHRFVESMYAFLEESGMRSIRPSFLNDYVYTGSSHKYWEDVKVMREVARGVIENRRTTSSSHKKDLLDAMLNGMDPKTGKGLEEETVIDNMITFLIAGHETTSGLLSFVFYELARNPAALKTAREEVNSVLGHGAITPAMLSQLPYITAVIRETLRLNPTAPAFSVMPKSNNPADYPIFIGKERYPIAQNQQCVAVLSEIHRDPAVYGDDANEFRPERMLDEPFGKLPKGAWKPFGNGARSCIGRAIAMQEAVMTIAILLQCFEFELADPDYKLVILKTLTVKPKDFKLRLRLRDGLDPTTLMGRLLSGSAHGVAPPQAMNLGSLGTRSLGSEAGASPLSTPSDQQTELFVCYGSNTGTCQSLAHTLAAEAPQHGFSPLVMPMDEAVEKMTDNKAPVVVITASYEGEPPDNAASFIKWLTAMAQGMKDGGNPLAGRLHAVYGCGHRDWIDTFQKIPTLVDGTLTRCGSKPVAVRGFSDAANDDIFNEFDSWADGSLWPALEREFQKSQKSMENSGSSADFGKHGRRAPSLNGGRIADLEVVRSRRTAELLQNGCEATVLEAETLTAPETPEKRHLKLRLTKDVKYASGDYLAILPVNHEETVKAVMNRFGLAIDSEVLLGGNLQSIGSGQISLHTLLREFLELNHPATDKNIRAISQSIPEQAQRNYLEKIAASRGAGEQRPTALQLLQLFPTAKLSLVEYLAMLPPLHVRQYSISSSPLQEADTCTLTYGVLDGKNGKHNQLGGAGLPGAASNYLADLKPNDRLWVSVRPSHHAFHLPKDLTACPLILVCSGSGLAPFRGFIQERAAALKAQPKISLAKCTLFIGCRHPDIDAIYAQELRAWEKDGVVELRYAFSTAPKRSEGCKYAQDLLWKHRGTFMPLVTDNQAKIFVCGSSKLVDGVSKCVVQAYAERMRKTTKEADAWFRAIRNDQFMSDVFN